MWHKYHAKRHVINGLNYDSKLEAEHGLELQIRKQAKEVTDFQRQVRFKYYVNDQHICDHIVDFLVTYPDGHQEVEEVKGFATPEWRIKHKLFLALYPDIPYNVITTNNKLRKPKTSGGRP